MPDARATLDEAQYGPIKKIGHGVSVPVVTYQVEPRFTEAARKKVFSGSVLVGLIVDKNGIPQSVHIIRGVGMGLDESAMAAVSQYRFKPAMENGEPVAVRLNVEVNFQIFKRPAGVNDVPNLHPGETRPASEQ